VFSTLKAHDEFSEFYDLLAGSEFCTGTMNLGGSKFTAAMSSKGNRNITLMDNYNYTVYVPTNESIRELIDNEILPTWDDYNAIKKEEWGTKALRDSAQQIVKDIINSFLRYHIQDHSIAVDMCPESYETDADGKPIKERPVTKNSYESMRRNTITGRFFPLEVDFSNKQMTIKDVMAQERHVVKDNGLYNLICREYWFSGSGLTAVIYSASDAVVHQIDGPLMFQQMTSWKEQLKALGRN
jgi:hypothetical protein